MKTLLLIMTLVTSINAFAVPREWYLASPKKIEVKGDELILTILLPCKNADPTEWMGNLVQGYDDEGDMAIGLAVVASLSSCVRGPMKSFQLKYDLKKEFSASEIADIREGNIELISADLAKTNLSN